MRRMTLCLGLAFVVSLGGLWATADQAAGYWKSISDVKGEEGKVTALWKLSIDGAGQLQGIIVWTPDSPADEKYKSKNREYNGLPVRNTVWMKGLKRSGSDGWSGGTIVDIGNDKGDVYGCEVKVTDGGKKLAMRGYMGISLLGRTQTWQAASAEEVRKLLGDHA